MDKYYFIGLLRKFLNNGATEQEEQFLIRYYNLFRNEPDVLELLKGADKEKLKMEIQNGIWQNISKKEQATGKLRSIRDWSVRVAAAAAVIYLFSTVLIYQDSSAPGRQEVATLHNQIEENHIIRLSDGSTVVLGSHSKIDYPSNFDGLASREVYLEGEAFFDITKDSLKPFIVHTGKVQTRVLGTAFNVKAFPDEKNITVTVKRGKVQVANQQKTLGIITPEQQIVYNKEEERSIQKAVIADAFLAWKEEDLFFDNLTFGEAARLLEDRFNVKILFLDESIRSKNFTTTLPAHQTLDVTLKGICEFNGAEYQYNKQTSTITIRNLKNNLKQ